MPAPGSTCHSGPGRGGGPVMTPAMRVPAALAPPAALAAAPAGAEAVAVASTAAAGASPEADAAAVSALTSLAAAPLVATAGAAGGAQGSGPSHRNHGGSAIPFSAAPSAPAVTAACSTRNLPIATAVKQQGRGELPAVAAAVAEAVAGGWLVEAVTFSDSPSAYVTRQERAGPARRKQLDAASCTARIMTQSACQNN